MPPQQCPGAAAWAGWTTDRGHDFVAPCSEGRTPSSANWEESLMLTSAWYQGESLKRLLQGAAVGVLATLVIGFGWGGWMLGSTAKMLADSTANSAVGG